MLQVYGHTRHKRAHARKRTAIDIGTASPATTCGATIRNASPRGFTIIELLVVVSLIVLLIALSLPAISKVRERAREMICKGRQRDLTVAVDTFSNDDDGRFPPMQRWVNGAEWSWRGILFEYTNQQPTVYDCPSETIQQYAKGAFNAVGQPVPGETHIPSGIGAVNVHWNQGSKFHPPFGRWDPRYPTYGTSRAPILRKGQIQSASQLILFGDGNSSYTYDDHYIWFEEDAFWIYKDNPIGGAGYNRAAVPMAGFQAEQGLERHGGEFEANYAFADGSVQLLDANNIPCTTSACWWDAQVDPH